MRKVLQVTAPSAAALDCAGLQPMEDKRREDSKKDKSMKKGSSRPDLKVMGYCCCYLSATAANLTSW